MNSSLRRASADGAKLVIESLAPELQTRRASVVIKSPPIISNLDTSCDLKSNSIEEPIIDRRVSSTLKKSNSSVKLEPSTLKNSNSSVKLESSSPLKLDENILKLQSLDSIAVNNIYSSDVTTNIPSLRKIKSLASIHLAGSDEIVDKKPTFARASTIASPTSSNQVSKSINELDKKSSLAIYELSINDESKLVGDLLVSSFCAPSKNNNSGLDSTEPKNRKGLKLRRQVFHPNFHNPANIAKAIEVKEPFELCLENSATKNPILISPRPQTHHNMVRESIENKLPQRSNTSMLPDIKMPIKTTKNNALPSIEITQIRNPVEQVPVVLPLIFSATDKETVTSIDFSSFL